MAAREDNRNQGVKQTPAETTNRLRTLVRALPQALVWALVLALVWALVLTLAFGALGMGPVGAQNDEGGTAKRVQVGPFPNPALRAMTFRASSVAHLNESSRGKVVALNSVIAGPPPGAPAHRWAMGAPGAWLDANSQSGTFGRTPH